MNVKDVVANGARARFSHYRKGNLIYVADNGLEFPVPVADCGDASFPAEIKAITLMRYIRKHLADLEADA